MFYHRLNDGQNYFPVELWRKSYFGDQAAQTQADQRLFSHGQFFSLDRRDNEITQNSFEGGVIFECLVQPPSAFLFTSWGKWDAYPINAFQHGNAQHEASDVRQISLNALLGRQILAVLGPTRFLLPNGCLRDI